MDNKKIIIGIMAIVIVGVFTFLNLRTEPTELSVEESSEVRKFYVVTTSWKPYSYEEDGEYKGIAVDTLELVMNRLEIPYTFEIIPWARSMRLVETGGADVLMSGSYAANRESFIAFTQEQLAYGRLGVPPRSFLHIVDGAFMVRTLTRDSFPFESIEQVTRENYRIGSNLGYRYDPAIDTAIDGGWNSVIHATEEESFEALANGEIDLFLTWRQPGLAIRNELGLQDEISYAKGPFPFKAYLFLMFSKNSDYPGIDELQRRVDEELIKIHESGEYQEIYDKYTKIENE